MKDAKALWTMADPKENEDAPEMVSKVPGSQHVACPLRPCMAAGKTSNLQCIDPAYMMQVDEAEQAELREQLFGADSDEEEDAINEVVVEPSEAKRKAEVYFEPSSCLPCYHLGLIGALRGPVKRSTSRNLAGG